MYSHNIFAQTLLSVYQEWQAFLASANGIMNFSYAGLNCLGLFDNGKWTVVVFDANNNPYEYTDRSKRELIRDFAIYIMGA